MRLMIGAATAALGMMLSANAWGINEVSVDNKTVSANATGVPIGIRIKNDAAITGVTVPLEIRTVSGATITALSMSFAGRLAGAFLSDVRVTEQYDGSVAGSMCKNNTPGGYGPPATYTDGASHPVTVFPMGVVFSATGASNPLPRDTDDAAGSMVLLVDVGPTYGQFEIDTTCMDPTTHLQYADLNSLPFTPSFSKGVITVPDPNNTPTGTNVPVSLPWQVTLNFQQVDAAGITTLTAGNSGPPSPAGFQILPPSQPVYYDLTTTAQFTGLVTVCFHYDSSSTVDPASLQLLHYDAGQLKWVPVLPVTIDQVAHTICGDVSSFSIFGVAHPFVCTCPKQGNLNGDGFINVLDVVAVINRVFKGAAPVKDPLCPRERADFNANGAINVLDVMGEINHVFKGGPLPVNPCGP